VIECESDFENLFLTPHSDWKIPSDLFNDIWVNDKEGIDLVNIQRSYEGEEKCLQYLFWNYFITEFFLEYQSKEENGAYEKNYGGIIQSLFRFISYYSNTSNKKVFTDLMYSLFFCQKDFVVNDFAFYFKTETEYIDTYSLVVEHKRKQNRDAKLYGAFHQASIGASLILENILQDKFIESDSEFEILKDKNELNS